MNIKFLIKGMGAYVALSGLVVFAVVLRDALLLPAMGPVAAQWLGAVLALAFVYALTALLLRMIQEPRGQVDLIALGLLWASVTIGLELYVYGVLLGVPAAELAASYAIWNGQAWPVILLGLALAPPLMGAHK